IGVLEVVNQAVRGHLAHGLRAGGARADCGAERQYNRKNSRQPPGFFLKTHSLLLEKVRAIPEYLLSCQCQALDSLGDCYDAVPVELDGRATGRKIWGSVPRRGACGVKLVHNKRPVRRTSCVVRSPWPSPPSFVCWASQPALSSRTRKPPSSSAIFISTSRASRRTRSSGWIPSAEPRRRSPGRTRSGSLTPCS